MVDGERVEFYVVGTPDSVVLESPEEMFFSRGLPHLWMHWRLGGTSGSMSLTLEQPPSHDLEEYSEAELMALWRKKKREVGEGNDG